MLIDVTINFSIKVSKTLFIIMLIKIIKAIIFDFNWFVSLFFSILFRLFDFISTNPERRKENLLKHLFWKFDCELWSTSRRIRAIFFKIF